MSLPSLLSLIPALLLAATMGMAQAAPKAADVAAPLPNGSNWLNMQ